MTDLVPPPVVRPRANRTLAVLAALALIAGAGAFAVAVIGNQRSAAKAQTTASQAKAAQTYGLQVFCTSLRAQIDTAAMLALLLNAQGLGGLRDGQARDLKGLRHYYGELGCSKVLREPRVPLRDTGASPAPSRHRAGAGPGPPLSQAAAPTPAPASSPTRTPRPGPTRTPPPTASPTPHPTRTPLVCVTAGPVSHCVGVDLTGQTSTRGTEDPMGFKDGWWVKADRHPLGEQTQPRITDLRGVVAHTIVGTLAGAQAVFKPGGYTGTEAHFGIGGPWDGKDLDGVAWQWQDIRHTADAQFAGNVTMVSVEHSDGGNPHNPESTKQLETDIELYCDILSAHNLPADLLASPSGKGIGYHEEFPSWNTDAHVCPGPVREAQLRTIVIPKVRARLAGKPDPHVAVYVSPSHTGKHDIHVDGVFGPLTVAALQHALKVDVDGVFGPATRKGLQRHLGTHPVDGSISRQDVKALQARLFHDGAFGPGFSRTTAVDGRWGVLTTLAIQRALNDGRL